MKKYGLCTLCAVLAVVLTAGAASTASSAARAGELLENLSAGFRAMKGYEVSFAVTTGERTLSGNYAIEGERYTLTLGDAEVFCDGKVRYEVDNRRHEVTVTTVDRTSRNLLNNPARAFDFLGSEYSPMLLWERDGKAAIRLTPTGKDSSGVITVTLTTSPVRPEALSYDYDGERIDVAVVKITPLTTPLKGYDKSKYAAYEQIDFR